MKPSKSAKKKEKFDIHVTALQYYMKEMGLNVGFDHWKKLTVRENAHGRNHFRNTTIRGVAVMQDFNDHGIKREIPVHFTYTQDLHMRFEFTDEG